MFRHRDLAHLKALELELAAMRLNAEVQQAQ
jgi:hypothetical protein